MTRSRPITFLASAAVIPLAALAVAAAPALRRAPRPPDLASERSNAAERRLGDRDRRQFGE